MPNVLGREVVGGGRAFGVERGGDVFLAGGGAGAGLTAGRRAGLDSIRGTGTGTGGSSTIFLSSSIVLERGALATVSGLLNNAVPEPVRPIGARLEMGFTLSTSWEVDREVEGPFDLAVTGSTFNLGVEGPASARCLTASPN